jgi:hypothetical protein
MLAVLAKSRHSVLTQAGRLAEEKHPLPVVHVHAGSQRNHYVQECGHAKLPRLS